MKRRLIGVDAALALASIVLCTSALASQRVEIPGHVPTAEIARSQDLGPAPNSERVELALSLPLQNQAALDLLLTRLYDPLDPLYGKYLSVQEFTATYGPSQQDYNALADWARANGLAVTGVHANRMVLNVAGSPRVVEQAFNVRLHHFVNPEGRRFRASDKEPDLPAGIASVVNSIVGLSTASVWRPHSRVRSQFGAHALGAAPRSIGTGPGGGMTPRDIKAAYNLSNVTRTGAGQTLGLFELDGYVATDVTTYESYYALPRVPMQNVLVDGFNGLAGPGRDEVTLDIELQAAIAPGAAKIIVYEGPNSSVGVVDTYNRIATDNQAKQISTSWGIYEAALTSAERNSENTIFKQMAAQGQTIYAAAGDNGAYDDGYSLSVDDPAGQPYMTGVGGTTLNVVSRGGPYLSEQAWLDGGGGITAVWAIPAYQAGLISGSSKGSTTGRNVPDVALNADPNTGYSIYVAGNWYVYGGTSCAAPLWAGYTALVNEQRTANALPLLGFLNPTLSTVGTGANYGSDLHDINDGSTNQFYPAVGSLDNSTGWGSFNGANLLADLTAGGAATQVPAPPANLTATAGNTSITLSWSASAGATSYNVKRSYTSGGPYNTIASNITTTSYTDSGLVNGNTYYYVGTAVNSAGQSGNSYQASATPQQASNNNQLFVNPAFENGPSAPGWTGTYGIITNSTSGEAPNSGSWYVWMGGKGIRYQYDLDQQVTIPANITKATLTFWVHIDSVDPSTSAVDLLQVQIRNANGLLVKQLATLSNLNKNVGYVQKTFDLTAYRGMTIRVHCQGSENAGGITSFALDDFALTVQ